MSCRFSLLKLYDGRLDTHPRSWICLSGPKLATTVANAERAVHARLGSSRESLSKGIAAKLHCSIGVVKRVLYGGTPYYPIPILFELARLLPTPIENVFLVKVERCARLLKVNSASAKPVHAVTMLDVRLAKIIGAFMADGSLSGQATMSTSSIEPLAYRLKESGFAARIRFSKTRRQYYASITLNSAVLLSLPKLARTPLAVQTHYAIELTEEHEDSVRAFNTWIAGTFGIAPTLMFKRPNAWRTVFANKIIARYLMMYFEIAPGSKTFTAHEPAIIKKMPLSIRKAFAEGVLMFDGSVNTVPAITFSSKSRKLWRAVRDILARDGVRTTNCKQNARGEWAFATAAHTPRRKLEAYFASGTQKHKLLLWMFGDMNQKPVIRTGKRISTEKIHRAVQDVRQCDVGYLCARFRSCDSVVRNLVRILIRQKRVTATRRPTTLSKYVSEQTATALHARFRSALFERVKRRWGTDLRASQSLEVKKATYSAWRRGKSRIPVSIVRKLLFFAGMSRDEFCGHIQSTDRIIIETAAMRKNPRLR